MTAPHFEIEYRQGPTAGYLDWVAGGNFDGYIQQTSLKFVEQHNKVIVQISILDQSKFDGSVENKEVIGKFEYTDKDTLTVWYEKFKMRGKIIGSNREYIVFTISHPLADKGWNAVYKLS